MRDKQQKIPKFTYKWPNDSFGANLEAKIGTYLEVNHGAKWDAKVVAKMDAILDANMVLLRMKIWN